MPAIDIRTRVNAPPARTFEVFTDLRNMARRLQGVTSIEVLSDGPVGAGTRWKETRVMFRREATEEMEIVAFEPPERFTIRCDSCGCRFDFTHTFTTDGDGTIVCLEGTATPTSFFARIMMVLMAPMMKSMRRACEKDMLDLARVAEGAA